MKKQVINLMMTLAIVFGLSVSAMAQSNTVLDPDTIFAGSAKTFAVSLTSGNYYAWNVLDVTSVTTTVTTYPYEYTATAASEVNDVSSATSANAENNNSFSTQFLESAAGLYAIRVTEEGRSNTEGNTYCTTVRDFFVYIVSFDVRVYACDINGDSIHGDALTHCGPDYDPFHNDMTTLSTYSGADPRDTSYVRVIIQSDDLPLSGYGWRFNYTMVGENFDTQANNKSNLDLVEPASGWTETGTLTRIIEAALADTITGEITVPAGTADIIIPVATNKLFSNDDSNNIPFNFIVDAASTVLYDPTDDDDTYNDGQEAANKFNTIQNTAATQTIVASPATSVITIGN